MTSVVAAVRRALLGPHLRELHFYFGTVGLSDIGGALVASLSRDGDRVAAFETAFAAKIGVGGAVAFGAGRMALYAILESLEIGPGDEVIIPAFTCVVVPNAIRYRGAIPVFADIDRHSWNISPANVERAVTPRTRAVLAQHTFGVPCDIDALTAIARRRGLFVIEDCAHVLGAKWRERTLGTLGDAAFFSFESSKPLTLGRGGIAVARDARVLERLRTIQRGLPEPGRWASLRSGIRLSVLAFLHRPSIFRFGKFGAGFLFRMRIFRPNITMDERRAMRPHGYPARLTHFQAILGSRQIANIAEFNGHRSELSRVYADAVARLGLAAPTDMSSDTDLPLLRFSFSLPDPARAVEHFADRQIELGRWFDSPVTPVRLTDPNLAMTGYRRGSCPVAEDIADHCVNFPTDPIITRSDAARIIDTLESYLARGEVAPAARFRRDP